MSWQSCLQAVAKASLGIVGPGCRLVLRGISRLQHLHCFESFLAGAVQNGIHRIRIHGFKSVGDGRRVRIAASHTEVIDVVHRHGRFGPGQNSRQRWPQADGAKRRLVSGRGQRVQRAIQPAVFSGFDARRAGLHEILRIEVRTARVGRTGRMHDRQMALVP